MAARKFIPVPPCAKSSEVNGDGATVVAHAREPLTIFNQSCSPTISTPEVLESLTVEYPGSR
jgi:hypothetical protein